MNKILNPDKAIRVATKLNASGQKIVVSGGCFDILHEGHLQYLKNSKKHGNALFVLLESDENIKKLKGQKRPVHNQEDRAKILAGVEFVDFIILLPKVIDSDIYDKLLFAIKPSVLATTKGDPNRFHKERQAKLVGGKVVDVINLIPDQSTSKYIDHVKNTHAK